MSLAVLIHGFLHKHLLAPADMTLQSVHALLERDAQATSSAVFVYDTTASAPFGAQLVKQDGGAEVFHMQTRAGAGSALVGFVKSVAFTSKGAAAQAPVSVLASTDSFLSLVPSLIALPGNNVRPAVNIHVSAQTSHTAAIGADGEATFAQVPALGSLFEGVGSLEAAGWAGAVVFSETAAEAALVGTGLAKAVNAAGFDLVNVFDGLTAGRELSAVDASAVSAKGDALPALLGSALEFFSYSGSATASQVIVVPASTYSAAAKAAVAASGSTDVGVLTVRVVKPWDAEAFAAALPKSAKAVHLFAEAAQSPFYDEVLSTLLASGSLKLKVKNLPVSSVSVPTVQEWATTVASVAGAKASAEPLKSLLSTEAKLASFWDLDATSGNTQSIAANLAAAFAASASDVSPVLDVKYDNFRQGGIQHANLLLAPASKKANEFTVSATAATAPASVLFITQPAAVFKAYEPISAQTVSDETSIVIACNWTTEEVAEKLPQSAKTTLASVAPGKSNLFLIDADKVAAALAIAHVALKASDVLELVFWTFFLPKGQSEKDAQAILLATPTFSTWHPTKLLEVNKAVRDAITQVEIQASWSEVPEGTEAAPALPTQLIATAAGPNADRTFQDPIASIVGTQAKSWHQPAHRLLFPEAFSTETVEEEKLRPDLPEKNFLITVTENRRLTPNTYDRNVFHIEFSTEGTGLKYAIGEALGIHGWNDKDEVLEFLNWYGLDPDAVISVPSRVEPSRIEQRTVFQLFQQNLDLFGKPGKSFYETLSKYATNKNEERALRFIACPDGASTFKKMSETETVTYADLLRQFPSARPSIEDLVREIEEIHPRHYSIASSQNFVGDSVHLLIVTVEWNTPKGSPRFGQCTRYLSGLKVGDKVMASVKPSVMKLPTNDQAPVIMAGLGTGAAPFRAFIQERAWQKAQGKDVGPMLYYFGSRHRSKEYLYGEEIEAYLQEGIVSHAGLAFSRDTDKKVYIQNKMAEDAELLAKSLKEGAFYLCGPTWPVPDVYAALIQALTGDGKTPDEAAAYIEELKEAERYVLEVY